MAKEQVVRARASLRFWEFAAVQNGWRMELADGLLAGGRIKS